jgi:hypothetical protein
MGNASIVWKYDENALMSELVGMSKGDLKNIISKFPAIARADVILKPFWKKTFPKDAKDISIVRASN